MSEWRVRSTPKTLAHLNQGAKCEDMALVLGKRKCFSFFSLMSAKNRKRQPQPFAICHLAVGGRQRERESATAFGCLSSTGSTPLDPHSHPLFQKTNLLLFSGCQVKCASETAMAVGNLHAVQRTNEQNKLTQGEHNRNVH